MSLLYLDTFSGISGDMMLGLLIDLGADLNLLKKQLDQLPVTGYTITARQAQRHGIGGTQVRVECGGPQTARTWSDIDTMLQLLGVR